MRRYYYIFNRLIAFCACVFMAVFCFNVTPATCHDVMPVNADLVAEGQPDECFYDIGSWDNFYNPKDLTGEQVRQCLAQGGTLKRNAGYVWGLTSSGDDLWFGTAANIGPVTLDIILATANQEFGLNLSLPPFQIDDILCEMDKSTYMDGELGFLGDYRPPRIFSYNLTSGAITEHTPEDPLLSITFGLRSAGYLNGVAIIAGPVIINDDGVKGINI